MLRVLLEGIDEEDARTATVTVRGVHDFDGWPVELAGVRSSWPCPGRTGEFDLDPILERVERHESLRKDRLEVAVEHPHRLAERARVLLDRGVELTSGKIVHEARGSLVRPELWPELGGSGVAGVGCRRVDLQEHPDAAHEATCAQELVDGAVQQAFDDEDQRLLMGM